MSVEFDAESPIIWRSNLKFSDEDIDKVRSEIISNREVFLTHSETGVGSMHSTYFIKDVFARPEVIFLDSYKKIVGEMIMDLGLYDSETTFDYWCQIYDGSHGIHYHLSAQVPLSFVHFIRPTDTRCFYFVTRNGEHLYPKQDPGDIIAFTSWAPHGIDESKGNERMSVAGNVLAEMIKAPGATDYQLPRKVRRGLYVTEHLKTDYGKN